MHWGIAAIFLFVLAIATRPGYASGCEGMSQCSSYIPKNHYHCNELQQAWKSTYECVARCGSTYAGGLIIGQCLASWDAYKNSQKCGQVENYPNFPSSEVLCGTEAERTLFGGVNRKCGKLLPLLKCDGVMMRRFMSCVYDSNADDFTKGVVKGGCHFYSLRGVPCNFKEDVCTYSADTWKRFDVGTTLRLTRGCGRGIRNCPLVMALVVVVLLLFFINIG